MNMLVTPARAAERLSDIEEGSPPERGGGPQWMRMAAALVCLLVGLWAASTAVGAWQRSAALDQVGIADAPAAASLAEVYVRFSDADQRMVRAYVLGPGAVEERTGDDSFRGDLRQALSALSTSLADRPDVAAAVAGVPAAVVDYVDNVELAFTNQALTGGAVAPSYLRTAENTMQLQVLPPLQSALATLRTTSAEPALARATATPYIATGTGVLVLLVLLGTQWRLAAQTRRRLDAGLLLATLVVVAGTAWSATAVAQAAERAGFAGAAGRLAATDAFVLAQIHAREARSAEIVWVQAAGARDIGDEAAARFAGSLDCIEYLTASVDPTVSCPAAAPAPPGATTATGRPRTVTLEWAGAHQRVRDALFSSAGIGVARELVLGRQVASSGAASGAVAALVDARAGQERQALESDVTAARSGLTALPWIALGAGVVAAVAACLGLRRRWREYR